MDYTLHRRQRARQAHAPLRRSTLLALGLLLALAGAPERGAATRGNFDDIELDDEVATAIRADIELWESDLEATSRERIVILEGRARTARARVWAAQRALGIEEVRAVVNLISVEPRTLRDSQLATSTTAALNRELGGERTRLGVKAQDGVVRLGGAVGSAAQQVRAWWAALGVRGVRGVQDALQIDFDRPRRDAEVGRDIRFRLARDVFVDEDWVLVTVRDGVVKLRGSVRSEAERSRVVHDAHVRGAREIDDQLQIRGNWALARGDRGSAPVRTASEIEKALLAALLEDPRVRSERIAAKVEGATVTLSGVATSEAERCAAAEDAWNTAGVASVKDELTVAAGPASGAPQGVAACTAADYLRLTTIAATGETHRRRGSGRPGTAGSSPTRPARRS